MTFSPLSSSLSPWFTLIFFSQSFHLSQYLRRHGPKAGKSNSEDFIWGKLQERAGSAITNVIAVAKVEAEILHTWRRSSLWLHCSSVAMLVKSHLRRPDREVRNHLSFADPRALSPRTNSFSPFLPVPGYVVPFQSILWTQRESSFQAFMGNDQNIWFTMSQISKWRIA